MEHRYRLPLDRPVAAGHLTELRRRVFFITEAITDFALVLDGDRAVAVDVRTAGPADPAALAAKLRFIVDNDVRPQLPTAPKRLWESPATRQASPTAFADMVADGVVHEVGPGRVALGQPALAAVDALDGLLRDLVTREWGAREYRYPTLLPLSALHRSGYLASFPHHLMVAARLRGDLDTYRAFAVAARGSGPVGDQVLARCGPVEQCLPPTMCYHTFHQLAGAALDAPGVVVTARGASFRHEARYHRTLERLADFTIRETVFLGSAAFVRRCRDRFRALATELVAALDLRGWCEVANDPFFAAADSADQVSAQRLRELKHELHLAVGPADSIAVGSFNLHDRHFGEAFDIRGVDGEIVYTSCVGFGLERLAYAVLCQYGWSTDRWPAPLRHRLGPQAPREGQP